MLLLITSSPTKKPKSVLQSTDEHEWHVVWEVCCTSGDRRRHWSFSCLVRFLGSCIWVTRAWCRGQYSPPPKTLLPFVASRSAFIFHLFPIFLPLACPTMTSHYFFSSFLYLFLSLSFFFKISSTWFSVSYSFFMVLLDTNSRTRCLFLT